MNVFTVLILRLFLFLILVCLRILLLFLHTAPGSSIVVLQYDRALSAYVPDPARTRCIFTFRILSNGGGVNDASLLLCGTAQGVDVKALFFFHLPYHVRCCTEKVFLGVAVGKDGDVGHFAFLPLPALRHPRGRHRRYPYRCRLSGRGNGRRPGMPVFLPLYPSIQMLYFPVQYSHLRRLLLTHFRWPQSTLYCCRWR